MKSLLIPVIFIIWQTNCLAQKIELLENQQPLTIDTIGAESVTRVHTVKLGFMLKGNIAHDTTIKLLLRAFNTHSRQANDSASVTFSPGDFSVAGLDKEVKKEVFIKFLPIKSSEQNGIVYISMPRSDNLVTITLTPQPAPPKPAAAKPDPGLQIVLEPGNDSINPLIVKEESRIKKHFERIAVRFKITGDLKEDSTITLKLIADSNSALKPVLKTTTVKIRHSQLAPAPSATTVSYYTDTVTLEVASVKDFNDDEFYYLAIDGGPAYYRSIRVTLEGRFNPNKPFWIEVGSNFDFADGLTPNNFFGGVFFYKKDIRPIFYRNPANINKKIRGITDKSDSTRLGRLNRALSRSKNLGIFAGVFESKTISDVSENNYAIRSYYDRNSPSKPVDSFGIFRDSGNIKTTQVVKSVGLFFSPQVRLTNGSANADGLHVSASLWLELQWQRLKVTEDYANMKRLDTFYIPKRSTDDYRSIQNSSEKDIRSHYFGIGLPVFFKEENTNVFFNPVIGFSNQPIERDINSFVLSPKTGATVDTAGLKRSYRPFYIFQFRLNEEKYGLTFTGEVRGLLKRNSSPLVSLALTKKFDLTKFIEFQK